MVRLLDHVEHDGAWAEVERDARAHNGGLHGCSDAALSAAVA